MWRDNMRLADMHIHTTFSPDGKSSMEEQCIKAIEIGIPIICFTDHIDFNSSEINVGRIINKASTNFDVSEYFYEVNIPALHQPRNISLQNKRRQFVKLIFSQFYFQVLLNDFRVPFASFYLRRRLYVITKPFVQPHSIFHIVLLFVITIIIIFLITLGKLHSNSNKKERT